MTEPIRAICCSRPIAHLRLTFLFLTVSKTTKELNLRWKEFAPVDISKEVKMPQFEISKIIPARCQETFHIGNSLSLTLLILISYVQFEF